MAKKEVIVCYAKNGREHYASVVERLVESARVNGYEGDFIVVSPDDPRTNISGAPNRLDIRVTPHSEVPYAFKLDLLNAAVNEGYEHIVWCDSTIFFVDNPSRLFDLFSPERPIVAFDNTGCPEATWTSDDALAKLGVSPEEARTFNQIMACCIAFDATSLVFKDVLDEWTALCRDGVTFAGRSGSKREDFRAHRHDQSAISALLWKRGIPLVPYGTLCYWADRHDFSECVVTNRGIGQP